MKRKLHEMLTCLGYMYMLVYYCMYVLFMYKLMGIERRKYYS